MDEFRTPEPLDTTITVMLHREDWRLYESALRGTQDIASLELREKITRHLDDQTVLNPHGALFIALDSRDVQALAQIGAAFIRTPGRSEQ